MDSEYARLKIEKLEKRRDKLTYYRGILTLLLPFTYCIVENYSDMIMRVDQEIRDTKELFY